LSDETPKPGPRDPAVWVLLALAALGFALRLKLALTTTGSNDIAHWHLFARAVREHGIAGTYAAEPLFNHPPIMGLLAAWTLRLAQATGLPFAFLWKVPGLAGEALTLVLLGRIWRARKGPLAGALAMALYGACVVSIANSGFHGSTDCLYAALSLLAVVVAEERPLLGGLTLGAAINVKLIPLLLVPAFLATCRTRRELGRTVAGLGLMALPFVAILAAAGAPFVHNALAYSSNVDRWGVSFLLGESMSSETLGPIARPLGAIYLAIGRPAVVLGVLALAGTGHARRRLSRGELALASYATFLVLTPGFGIQYLVLVAPLLYAHDLVRGALYGTLAGVASAITYWTFMIPGQTLSNHVQPLPLPAALFGLLAWAVLGELLARSWGRLLASSGVPPLPSGP
jgi:hypothetical protein